VRNRSERQKEEENTIGWDNKPKVKVRESYGMCRKRHRKRSKTEAKRFTRKKEKVIDMSVDRKGETKDI
jgi:hypothetical protein